MVRVWPYFQFQLLKRDKSTLQIELGSVCLNGHTTLTTGIKGMHYSGRMEISLHCLSLIFNNYRF